MTRGSQNPEHHKLLTTPEADELAELYLLQGDLNAAHDTLTLYLEKFEFSENLSHEGRIISMSLFRDAILLYCSCFSTKERNKLEPAAVYGHMPDWAPFYRKLLDTRDAFVAHNFGPQRQHQIVVVCPEIAGELVPAAFTQVYVRFAGWIASETKKLLSFINIAQDHLKQRIEAAEQLVTKALQSISSPELRALPDAELSLPDDRDIRLSRSRFRARGRGERRPLPPRRWGRVILDESGIHRVNPLDGGDDTEGR